MVYSCNKVIAIQIPVQFLSTIAKIILRLTLLLLFPFIKIYNKTLKSLELTPKF